MFCKELGRSRTKRRSKCFAHRSQRAAQNNYKLHLMFSDLPTLVIALWLFSHTNTQFSSLPRLNTFSDKLLFCWIIASKFNLCWLEGRGLKSRGIYKIFAYKFPLQFLDQLKKDPVNPTRPGIEPMVSEEAAGCVTSSAMRRVIFLLINEI